MSISSKAIYKLSKREWELLNAVVGAWTIREAARRAGIPYTTARKVIMEWKEKGDMAFQVDYQKMNLMPLYIFTESKPSPEPPLTFSIRRAYWNRPLYLIHALVPTVYVDKYLEALGEEPITVIKAYSYKRWFPGSLGTKYNEEAGMVEYDVEGAIITGLSERPPPEWERSDKAPDKVDLAVIQGRMKDIFMRPGDALERARKIDPSIPDISRQLLSYHVNRHVLPLWRGNVVNFYYESKETPLTVYLIKGDKAHSAAAALVSMPGFFEAAIDKNKALVIGQPPYRETTAVFEILEKFKVSLEGGAITLHPENLVEKPPYLWKYSEEGKWVWPK